jgi:hypothetical protein
MTYRLLAILILFPVTINYGVTGSAVKSTADSLQSPPGITLPLYRIDSTVVADSMRLNPGDSVFIYSGEQYFRARVGKLECFVSRAEILSHADSLTVYQNLRLQPPQTGLAEQSDVKVERQRCTMITKNGTRCKRLALPGSDRCWQHKR